MDDATSAEELNELGIELVDRYEQEGDPALLRRAREAHEHALRKAVTVADRAAYLNNVGNCLRLEYWETRDPADLEVARQRFESAVATALPGSADRPMYLDNLALALRDQYADTGNRPDLDRAVALHEEALATATDGAAEKLLYMNNQLRSRAGGHDARTCRRGHHTFLAGSPYAAGQSRRGAPRPLPVGGRSARPGPGD